MNTLKISRFTSDLKLGTLAIATINDDEDQQFSYLEPPWIDNRPFESCVPSGSYAGVMMNSPRFGPVYYLIGGNVVYEEKDVDEVQTRYLCIAGHSANWHQQLQGCGAFGMGHEENHAGHERYSGGQRSHYVRSSKNALKAAHAALGSAPVIQVIIGWDL